MRTIIGVIVALSAPQLAACASSDAMDKGAAQAGAASPAVGQVGWWGYALSGPVTPGQSTIIADGICNDAKILQQSVPRLTPREEASLKEQEVAIRAVSDEDRQNQRWAALLGTREYAARSIYMVAGNMLAACKLRKGPANLDLKFWGRVVGLLSIQDFDGWVDTLQQNGIDLRGDLKRDGVSSWRSKSKWAQMRQSLLGGIAEKTLVPLIESK